MLPESVARSRYRWIGITLLALSPLAYFAAAGLMRQTDPWARAGFNYDREGAIGFARKYAAARGFAVAGWDTYVKANGDAKLLGYFSHLDSAVQQRLQRWTPATQARVLFVSPDSSETLEVQLAADGRVLGYTRRATTDPKVKVTDPGEPASREAATAAARPWAELLEIRDLQTPTEKDDTNSKPITRRYQWLLPSLADAGLETTLTVAVQGGKIREELLAAEPKQELSNIRVQAAAGVTLGLIFVAIFVLGIHRFVQRARQKEVSYQRIALIGAFLAVATAAKLLMSDTAVYDRVLIPGQSWAGIIISLFVGALVVVVLAFPYGSGEGDLREVFPGKLTSLDALLRGKVFSSNVASAALFGLALAGLGMVVKLGLVKLLIGVSSLDSGLTSPELFSRWPAIHPLAKPADSISEAVIILLVILPFLCRRLRSQKKSLWVLGILYLAFGGVATLLVPGAGFHAWLLTPVTALVYLGAFAAGDLLTAIIASSAVGNFSLAMILSSQASPALQSAGWLSMLFALVGIAVLVVAAVKGRHFTDEQVRPLYARHLAERMEMQGHLAAAREAQSRLMPAAGQSFPGFQVAAACRPAHEVGGDFYDLFPLADGRLGIFMAEGDGQGISAALTIAFAKGFLLPRVARNAQDPAELAAELQRRLEPIQKGEARGGLMYAVLDPRSRSLTYGRVGDYPRVRILGGGAARSAEENARTDRVTAGSARLLPGEGVILFTNGVADVVEDGWLPRAWERGFRGKDNDGSNALAEALLQKILKKTENLERTSGIKDDHTAVLVQIPGFVRDGGTGGGAHES